MKNSQFNTFFKHEGLELGYNSFTNEFIVLDPILIDLYKIGLRKRNFSELEEIHPDFYNFLIQQGFLVEDNIDEFESVKALSNKVDNDDSFFHLVVNPTMNCNFKCWYCYETHIKDSKMDSETLQNVAKFAENIINNQINIKRFILSFFGGEPLLYFDKVIVPLLSQISLMCINRNIDFSSHMTTNGLLINEKKLALCKRYGLNSFQITLDGSREQHNKVRYISEERGSYDEIIRNIILIARNGLRANVRVNCSLPTMINIEDILTEFQHLTEIERENITFDFQKVWQEDDKNIGQLLEEVRPSFRKSGFQVSSHNSGTILESCYADKRHQATINYNGEVFKCTARDFKNGSGEGVVNKDGEVVWNDRFEQRLNSKFKNAPCKECRILPLCGGGCTQQAIEAGTKDYCVMNFDEDVKTQLIVAKFLELQIAN
jgi:uncharacterized protein